MLPEFRGGGIWLQEALGIFQTVETILYDTITETCHYNLHEPIKCKTQRVNSNVSLCVIIMW
jgi:hypothetical protein